MQHEELVQFLLANNVKYDKNNKSDEFNVFHLAAKYDNVNILRLLADKFKRK